MRSDVIVKKTDTNDKRVVTEEVLSRCSVGPQCLGFKLQGTKHTWGLRLWFCGRTCA